MRLSREFLIRLKVDSEEPAWRVCQEAGVNPVRFSQLLNGKSQIQPNDPRIIAVGEVLGLASDECFEVAEMPRIEEIQDEQRTTRRTTTHIDR
jgi:hypothetical protein